VTGVDRDRIATDADPDGRCRSLGGLRADHRRAGLTRRGVRPGRRSARHDEQCEGQEGRRTTPRPDHGVSQG
jgi:hypothetical protein